MEENEILTNEEFTEDSVNDLSEEMSDVADPNESEESVEVEQTEQAEQTETQNEVDVNAIYAEARRVAEAN